MRVQLMAGPSWQTLYGCEKPRKAERTRSTRVSGATKLALTIPLRARWETISYEDVARKRYPQRVNDAMSGVNDSFTSQALLCVKTLPLLRVAARALQCNM